MATITDKVSEATGQAVEKIKASDIAQGVKETLVGTEVDVPASAAIRASFAQHAKKDEETGEEYMDQADFVDAIAPVDEDYVSTFPFLSLSVHKHCMRSGVIRGM